MPTFNDSERPVIGIVTVVLAALLWSSRQL